MPDPSLDKLLQVAQEAALIAGLKIRKALISTETVQFATKSASTDLVTETDEQCEKLITEQIQNNFPDHKIIGEESSGSDKYELTDSPTWTIDPIDGTTNFVHRLKLSCVIISHLVNKEVCVAVIYDPYADEMFWAIKGKGAFLKTGNGESVPIHVSTTKSISNAVISMDPGYGRGKVAVQRYCAIQGAILSRSVRNLRVIGCTGLNMAWVACGRLDGGFEEGSWEGNGGPKIWDFAAGLLLIEEAGGITRDIESPLSEEGPLDVMKRSFFCAANPTLAEEILQGIAEGRNACT
jgi:inositol-phosphate phosphatase/L-galactose 1-phosphate phosphatase